MVGKAEASLVFFSAQLSSGYTSNNNVSTEINECVLKESFDVECGMEIIVLKY